MAKYSETKDIGVGQNGGSSVNVVTNFSQLPAEPTLGENFYNIVDNQLAVYVGPDPGYQYYEFINEDPIVTPFDTKISLPVDSSPYLLTLDATDPEGFLLKYSYASADIENKASITQLTNNSFSIQSLTVNPVSFTVNFTVTDGVNDVGIDILFTANLDWTTKLSSDSSIVLDTNLPQYTPSTDPWPGNIPLEIDVSEDGTWMMAMSSSVNDSRDQSIGVWFYENVDGDWIYRQKIDQAVNGTQFGNYGSIGNTYAAITQRNTINTEINVLNLYKLESGVWTFKTNLQVPSVIDGNISAVSMTDTYIVLGAERNNSGQGTVWVYKIVNDSLSFITLLSSPNRDQNLGGSRFGRSVSISGNTFVVGEQLANWFHSDTNRNHGAAYVYDIDDNDVIGPATQLLPPNTTNYTNFGDSIMIAGDYITGTAARNFNYADTTAGLFVFERSGVTWGDAITLEPATGPVSYFTQPAIGIDSDNDIVVVTSYEGNSFAVVWTKSNNWNEQARLNAVGEVNSFYGQVYGNNIIIRTNPQYEIFFKG